MSLNIISGNSADYMNEHFVQASLVHSFGTRFRESKCFTVPKVKDFGVVGCGENVITKTRLFKYVGNFTSKN